MDSSRRHGAELLARARRAAHDWRAASVAERLAVIARFRDRLAAGATELALAIDQRPAAESLSGEIMPLLACCRHLERHAAHVLRTRRRGTRVGFWLAATGVEVERVPFGTVLIVAPSNYPLMLAGIQALQALVAGNAVIIKPAPGARALTERLVALLERSGLPKSLLQIADESVATAEALLALRVDKLVFTGSNESGQAVLMRASEKLVPTTLELSGWDACLVLEGADLERAAAAIAFALRFNGGRTCLAPRRTIVADGVYEPFVAALARRLAPQEKTVIDPTLASRLAELVTDAERHGARLLAGTVTSETATGPCVVADVEPWMPIFSTELFGPVALVTRAASEVGAIELANSTRFGLGACVFGPPRAARQLADRLESGVVMINDAVVPAAHPELPLAPRRGSGFGTTRGREGLLDMTRPKAIATSRARYPLHLVEGKAPPPALIQAYIEAAYRSGLKPRLRALLSARRALMSSNRKEIDRCR